MYTPHHKPDPEAKERERREQRRHIQIYRATIAGVIVVAASTVVAALTGFLIRDQLGVMQAQLDDSFYQQRAWLTIDAKPSGSFIVDDKGAVAFVTVTVSNVGRLPALNVFALTTIYASGTENGPQAGAKRTCPFETLPPGDGVVVFPSQMVTLPVEIPKMPIAEVVQFGDLNNEVYFGLPVCVFYKSGENPQWHWTGIWFAVIKTEVGHLIPDAFNIRGERVDQNGWALTRLPVGDTAQ